MREFDSKARILGQKLQQMRNSKLSKDPTMRAKIDECLATHYEMIANYYFYPRPDNVNKFRDACNEMCLHHISTVCSNSLFDFNDVDNDNLHDIADHSASLSRMFAGEAMNCAIAGFVITGSLFGLSPENVEKLQDIFNNELFKKCTQPLKRVDKMLSNLVKRLIAFWGVCGLPWLKPYSYYIVVTVLWSCASGLLFTFWPAMKEMVQTLSQATINYVTNSALKNIKRSSDDSSKQCIIESSSDDPSKQSDTESSSDDSSKQSDTESSSDDSSKQSDTESSSDDSSNQSDTESSSDDSSKPSTSDDDKV